MDLLTPYAHTFLFAVYRAYAKSNGQWAARSVILGFFVAPIEALPEISVTDVVSSHSTHIETINWLVIDYEHMTVLHPRTRHLHGHLLPISSRQQLLRPSDMRIHRAVPRLAMGVFLAQHIFGCRFCFSLFSYGRN